MVCTFLVSQCELLWQASGQGISSDAALVEDLTGHDFGFLDTSFNFGNDDDWTFNSLFPLEFSIAQLSGDALSSKAQAEAQSSVSMSIPTVQSDQDGRSFFGPQSPNTFVGRPTILTATPQDEAQDAQRFQHIV